jgi:hypothetical protein
MKTWKKVVLGMAAVPLALLAFAIWYRVHFSMDPAKPFEVNRPEAEQHVLIATQGSAFKDAVVQKVVARFKDRSVHVKVIDVGALADVREADWNAIVVLHTWEMGKPPAPVQAFIERARSRDKLVVLATSGQGKERMVGVDTITAASRRASEMAKVPSYADEIVDRLDKLLAVPSPQSFRSSKTRLPSDSMAKMSRLEPPPSSVCW